MQTFFQPRATRSLVPSSAWVDGVQGLHIQDEYVLEVSPSCQLLKLESDILERIWNDLEVLMWAMGTASCLLKNSLLSLRP